MYNSPLIILFFFVPFWSSSQSSPLISYYDDHDDSFCLDRVELYPDSTFCYEWGCESRVAFILGKFTKENDTVYLHRAAPSKELLIDSVSYLCSDNKSDTVSISFYSASQVKYRSDVFISDQIGSQLWLDSLKLPNEKKFVWKFNREAEYYFKHGKHAEPSIYYNGWEYVKRTDSSLFVCLHNLALSTGVRVMIPIPREAIEISIYTRLPQQSCKE